MNKEHKSFWIWGNRNACARFNVVALLACRNEELYLHRVLEHLIGQGIEVVLIDNDSIDNTVAIAQEYMGKGLRQIIHYPYNGFFDHAGILKMKEKLASEIDADWIISYDADEIREAPACYKNLYEAIKDVDRQGFNAINFNEFVFLPTTDSDNFEKSDFVGSMRYYYFFEPRKYHRLNAWKKQRKSVDLISTGGHRVHFRSIKVFPENFILRHYIGLSRQHLIEKYTKERIYSAEEVHQRGWHGGRVGFVPGKLVITPKELLKDTMQGSWDTSDPWKKHLFLGES